MKNSSAAEGLLVAKTMHFIDPFKIKASFCSASGRLLMSSSNRKKCSVFRKKKRKHMRETKLKGTEIQVEAAEIMSADLMFETYFAACFYLQS